MLERALVEPPEPGHVAAVLHALGEAQIVAGRQLAGVQSLRKAAALAFDARMQSDVAVSLAGAVGAVEGPAAAVAVLDDAAQQLVAEHPDLALRLRAEATWMTSLDATLAAQLPARVAGAVGLEGRTAGERSLLALALTLMVYSGSPAASVVPVARRALGPGALAADSAPASAPHLVAVHMLLWCDELDLAEQEIELMMAAGVAAGRLRIAGFASHARGVLRLLQGRLREAECDLEVAAATLVQTPDGDLARESLAGSIAEVQMLVRGPVAAFAQLEASGMAGELELGPANAMTLAARAQVHLKLGRPADALADVREIARFQEISGYRSPVHDGGPWQALAQLALGDRDAAHATAQANLERAERWGTVPVVGRALRVKGLCAGCDAGQPDLRGAVDILRTGRSRVSSAVALCDLGSALRRAGKRREAREVLEEAADLAHHAGAAALASEARAELRVAGARPRRRAFSGLDALTASERRIAELAADGLTNREIAQRLFVTTKTVEGHLAASFRTLGTSSRTKLGEILPGPGA